MGREVIDDVLLVYPFLSFKKQFTSFCIATSFPKIPAQIFKKNMNQFLEKRKKGGSKITPPPPRNKEAETKRTEIYITFETLVGFFTFQINVNIYSFSSGCRTFGVPREHC